MLKPSLVALAAVLGLAAFVSAPAFADDASSSSASAPAADTSSSGVVASLNIPTITTVDSSMDQDAIRDALTGNFAAHVKDLQTLNATSIKIPEIDLKVLVTGEGASSTETVYKDIEIDNVKNGIAGGFSIGSTDTSGAQGTAHLGRIAADYLDVNALLGLYFGSAGGTPGTDMVPLQKNLTAEGGTIGDPTFKCSIGKESIAEYDVKPLKMALGQVITTIQGMKQANGELSPEGTKVVVPFFIDLFESLKSTPISFDGFDCSGTAADTNTPFQMSTGAINIDGFAPGIIPGLTMNGFKFNGNGVLMTLAGTTIKPTDLSAPFAALQAAGDTLSDDWFAANGRKLIPAWGGFSLSGLDITGPDPTSPGNQLTVKVGGVDLSLDHYVNGIPTLVSTSASAVDVPIPDDPTNPNLALFRQAGITATNLNFDFSASWDKPTKTIAIEKLSLGDPSLFDTSMSMVLGNAQDALFDSDDSVSAAAAQALTLNSIHISLTDRGVADKIVPLIAAQQSIDPKAFRAAMAGQLEAAVLATMGATDDASKLATAIGTFVNGGAKSLDVTIAAKDAAGVPLQTLEQAQSDPSGLMNLVTVTGTAQ